MTDHTRTTARLASWGVFLTVGGLVLLIVAAHQSAFYAAWSAVGQPPVVIDEYGGMTPVANWAPWVGGPALVAVLLGVWCLVAVVWRIADRADLGRPGALNRPGAPLPPATRALEPVPSHTTD